MPASRVQGAVSAGSTGTGANGVSVTLSAAVGNGNSVVGIVTWDYSSGATISITDDKGNTYTQVDTVSDPPFTQRVLSFYLTNITNAPTTITANFSTSTAWSRILVDEYSGIAATSAIDGHTGAQQNS